MRAVQVYCLNSLCLLFVLYIVKNCNARTRKFIIQIQLNLKLLYLKIVKSIIIYHGAMAN